MGNPGTFAPASGELTLLVGADPGPGAFPTLTIPATTRVQVMSCAMDVTIDVTIPSRHVGFTFTRGANTILSTGTSFVLTGGIAYQVNAHSGTGISAGAYQRFVGIFLPSPFFLQSGDVITAWDELLNAADVFGPIRLYCLRWIAP